MGTAFFWLFFLISLATTSASFGGPAQDPTAGGAAAVAPSSMPSSNSKYPIFDISTVATATPHSLLGSEVVATHVRVNEVIEHGFWVTAEDGTDSVYVIPAEGSLITVRVGELVDVHGEVRLMRKTSDRPPIANHTSQSLIPYVYAYTVRPAWPTGHSGEQAATHGRRDLTEGIEPYLPVP